MTFPLTRQGWVKVCAGCAAPRASIPTGRDKLKLPSKRGCAGGERQRAVGFDAERMIDRIDIDVKLERALLAQTADSDTIWIKLAGDGDGALALHRADKRARFAVEPHPFERDACAIGRVGERDRAILDAQPVDRQFIRA